MFVWGCLQLQSQNHTGVQGFFCADEQPVEGVQRQPAHAFNWPERVNVPFNLFVLEAVRLQKLHQQVNPLAGSRDSIGVDLLEEVLSFLSS